MKVFVLAIGFMAVFEGLMPLVAPDWWQSQLRRIGDMPASVVRRTAFAVVCLALAVVWGATLGL